MIKRTIGTGIAIIIVGEIMSDVLYNNHINKGKKFKAFFFYPLRFIINRGRLIK